MSRVPIDDRPAISQWLIRARMTQGGDYTVERFLADLEAESGGAPNRATYARWESGAVTPKDTSLVPVFAFWSARGIAAPGPSGEPGALSLEERQLAVQIRLADAAEEANRIARAQLEIMRLLLPTEKSDEALAAIGRAWAAPLLARTPQPDHESQAPTRA